ncbi:ABC transporter substrate-binding protein [Mangrovibacillus cuniculi]|uniref:ABC transporter substrate-binding protein n=1 Tax=Mangrovibacillus cuniculi TaxID=2593652 RepID=A0A7S8CA03_9BACI|nr:ABC transporter substrate-binding protein [Mangrovibacillus cuniculi]QPC45943.1 ABC transporter substrate-binding protein [Mangrovibacillus cuniculi]
MKRKFFSVITIASAILVGACGNQASQEDNKVTVVLDWTPNTNHTGLYVAEAEGYFEQQGLEVDIMLPGEAGAEALVASGKADFGISYQENVTLSRTEDIPVVSVAAIIQHNTSGFASPVDKNITSPKDFEGKRYGGFGAPVEEAVLGAVMKQDGVDVSKVENINIGNADYFTAVKRDIDFSWIFYGWTGIEAELRGEPVNMLYLTDFSDNLDYYTPVIITSEDKVKEEPEQIEKFLSATAAGYNFAMENPEDAAQHLIDAVPDLNEELVKASQKWLANEYARDAEYWGQQKETVWTNYANWMKENELLTGEFIAEEAFTNDFLPKEAQ